MIKEMMIPKTDDDLYGVQEKAPDFTEQFVLFRLNSEWYGIRMESVREITQALAMTRFPSMPHSIVGMTHVRGSILSVTDPKRLFKIPETAITKQSRFVIIESETKETALLVDEVAEVMAIPLSSLEPPLVTLNSEQAHCVEYTCSWKNYLIAILKIEKLFL